MKVKDVLIEIDKKLSAISVKGNDIFTMVEARQMLGLTISQLATLENQEKNHVSECTDQSTAGSESDK